MSTTDADYYRLRTEWLRFKSQLHDNLTGLTALPAVVDLVRRAVEAHGAVDLVYVDLGRSGWHESKLGWAAYDEGVREFAGVLALLRSEGAIGPDDVACLHTVRSDRFLVFLAASAESKGAGSAQARDKLLRATRQRMGGTASSRLLRSLRLAAGHARIADDPMVRSWRAVRPSGFFTAWASSATTRPQSTPASDGASRRTTP